MDDQQFPSSSTSLSGEDSIAAPQSASETEPSPAPLPARSSPSFDPRRMIGIVKRKSLIKKLAAAYHAECLSYCQELLELQKNSQTPFITTKHQDDSMKEIMRPLKRSKKTR